MKFILFLFVTILAIFRFSPMVLGDEEITSEEERFARIYQKINSQEMGDSKWTEIAGDKAAENYILQDGDNLWDISVKLFGNGYYWPKVWQLNDDITNPHLVERGKNLNFTPGSSSSPPSLSVDADINQQLSSATTSKIEEENEGPEFDTVVTQNAPEGDQIVIPPGLRSRPVLNKIPPSFNGGYHQSNEYDRKTGFAKDGLVKVQTKLLPSTVPSIVVEKPWEADGKIIEMEGDSTVASTFQTVIIKLSKPTQIGSAFTVFSLNGKVTDPTTDNTIGVDLETRAEIETEEEIAGSENTYRGMIVFCDLPVRLGDSVKSGKLITRSNFEAVGPMSPVAARIINGEANKRAILGLHNIVYLDKGAEDGLQVGSLLYVLKNIETRNEDTLLKFDSRPIGIIKTVEVEPHVATAVIVTEKDGIRPGDMTQLEVPDKSESPKSEDNLRPREDTVVNDEN